MTMERGAIYLSYLRYETIKAVGILAGIESIL